ncbi:MAG: ATP synthase F0 subunit B [Deferribacterales bacterium]|uniref:ATP synthase F0 subunit B n=1 Tax=Deferrivibrio essentukiensis TaxID=2880922 RepID=UPI0019B5B2AA|nr:ATP synthase F0 subunit B [Deferrivibrio essentukiensis]MBC7195643.1 ATP synthase F0 subunit B [Deferribacterales bacterium]MBZ4672947.1 H+transporting two-sector ATPase subunit [Deferribacteraceae bacterium]MCB4203635.1 ATP synthase F0 subunit B [Deferrivibrio essentukiensis]
MISIDYTLLIQMINFLIIFFIGKKLIYDPMLSNIDSRDSKIKSLLESAGNLRAEVEKNKKEYEEKLQQVRAEVAEYQGKIRQQAVTEAYEKVSKVKEEIDKKIETARKELEIQVEKAKVSLETEANGLADEIVAKILGKVA